MSREKNIKVPERVHRVLAGLRAASFDAYVVGGCVRDVMLKKEPKDWDVATNAQPEQIQKVFPKSFYENKFGTVTVHESGMEVQVTTYRIDHHYTDKRRPDEVTYTQDLKEDLARRDFTINAMAFGHDEKIVDPFHGEKDLREELVRAVGSPHERFEEDALRLMRAVRFATQLNFTIEKETLAAIKESSSSIAHVSQERIRDEFVKMIMSVHAARGAELLRETGLLAYIIPEILEGVGVTQNKHHIYTVYEHNLRALAYAAEQNYNLSVRLAAFFHDVAKPRTKRGEGPNATFYNHDIFGAKVSKNIMQRMKFSTADIEKVFLLVRYHLFYYNVDEVTPSSVRRLIKNVGLENMDDLINVRFADRIGSGVPKAEPYKLRHFRYMVHSLSKDPISVKMLKVNGDDVMRILGISPSPKIGIILNAMLSEVLDNPKLNTEEYLDDRMVELNKMSVSELSDMIKKADEHIQIFESEERRKFNV
ncbi:MAG: CCA tRNA nucleotidyltransferase [Patescibacteria group bacterium]